ncbi:glycosyltransferase [Polaromonas sp. P1(28)-13]|nr:glycosyltransferase [Polaromonas sp. P1(28)-13]
MLVVVGNAAHIPAFREQAEAFKLGGRVFFLGSLKDVRPAYEAADCLVHPTLEDTFAMVVLEAMAYGLPVVVSGPQYCGISGLLQHAVNAMILDDPRDVNNLVQLVARVLGQQTLQDQLAQGAKEFASALPVERDCVEAAGLVFFSTRRQEKHRSAMTGRVVRRPV